MPEALVIHGGTGARPAPARAREMKRRLTRIYREAEAYLRTHTALEGAVLAVTLLEDDPLFNAGTGSMLQEDGIARMSASVMDGAARRFAAVLNIERVRNPVLVAQALLDRPDRILAGRGATAFARSLGFGPWDPVTEARRAQWRAKRQDGAGHGTVGAIALDRAGRLAAATSTGGRGFERVGRVSDSGLPAGNYANDAAGVSCTGVGEDIVDEAAAVRLADRVADGRPFPAACAGLFDEWRARDRQLGVIALSRRGEVAWGTTLPALIAMGRRRGRLAASF